MLASLLAIFFGQSFQIISNHALEILEHVWHVPLSTFVSLELASASYIAKTYLLNHFT